jgi:hypothetical protein
MSQQKKRDKHLLSKKTRKKLVVDITSIIAECDNCDNYIDIILHGYNRPGLCDMTDEQLID